MNPPQDKNQEVCNKGIMKENHKVIKCDCKDTEDNLKKEIKEWTKIYKRNFRKNNRTTYGTLSNISNSREVDVRQAKLEYYNLAKSETLKKVFEKMTKLRKSRYNTKVFEFFCNELKQKLKELKTKE